MGPETIWEKIDENKKGRDPLILQFHFLLIFSLSQNVGSFFVHFRTLVLCQTYGWTDRQTDGHTDRHTDGRPDFTDVCF